MTFLTVLFLIEGVWMYNASFNPLPYADVKACELDLPNAAGILTNMGTPQFALACVAAEGPAEAVKNLYDEVSSQ